MEPVALKLPYVALQRVSQHVDESGQTCTVVLRNTAQVPAEVVGDGGSYQANGDAVVVLPGALEAFIDAALTARPSEGAVPKRGLARIKTLLGTDDDASARAVAAFLKKHRTKRRPNVASCLQALRRIALSVLVPCLVGILFYLGATWLVRPMTFQDRYKGTALALNFGLVLPCVNALLHESMGMSKGCAATCALLLAVALANATYDLWLKDERQLDTLVAKTVSVAAGSALVVGMLQLLA